MTPNLFQLAIFTIAILISESGCDDAVVVDAAAAAAVPPPVAPPPIPPGLGGLAGFFPGAGLGFQKNLNINAGAGFGPFGGFGGFGGVPPVVDGAPVDPALGGGTGFVGPSYIPSTLLGSALSAKGDILFPIVVFIFFVVGVWAVVTFLLGLIVPLIAAKFSVLEGVTQGLRHRRDLTPQEQKDEQVNNLTGVVMAAFENVGCMKVVACHTGNFVHIIAGPDKVTQYESSLETMKLMSPEMAEIFKEAAKTGKSDCNQYPCRKNESANRKLVADEE